MAQCPLRGRRLLQFWLFLSQVLTELLQVTGSPQRYHRSELFPSEGSAPSGQLLSAGVTHRTRGSLVPVSLHLFISSSPQTSFPASLLPWHGECGLPRLPRSPVTRVVSQMTTSVPNS